MSTRWLCIRVAIVWLTWAAAVPASAQPNLADLLESEDSVSPAANSAAVDFPAPAPASQGGPPKEPIPTAADTKKAILAIQEIFRSEFAAANTPDKRVAFAQQLLTEAKRTKKSTDRWALLVEAARLASAAGDPATTFAVIDATDAVYSMDSATVRLEAIGELIRTTAVENMPDLASSCSNLCRSLVDDGRLSEAQKALALANAAAKKTRDRLLIKEVNALTIMIKDAEKHAIQKDRILRLLTENPNDPDVCLEAGRFFSFENADWAKGLPLLAKGSDESLAAVAQKDLQSIEDAVAVRTAGDAWWEWAETQPAEARNLARLRAADLYGQTLEIATGLEKLKLEKRISAARTAGVANPRLSQALPKGLILWLDASAAGSVQVIESNGSQLRRVACWHDISGQGHNAVQQDPTLQPLWQKPGPNQKGAILFDGRTALAVNMPCKTSGTILAVVTPATATANMRTIGAISKPGAFVGISLRGNGSVWAEASSRGDSAVLCQSRPNAYVANQPMVVGQTWGKGLMVWLNAAPAGPERAIPAGVPIPGPWGIGGATLGMGIEFFSGGVLELLVFDREMSAEEFAKIAREKMLKWGVR